MPEELPYLRFRAPDLVDVPARTKRGGRMQKPSRQEQWDRLGPALKNLQESLERRTLELSESAPGAAAEDVLVFELAGATEDFFAAVRATPGMEWLAETEDDLPMDQAEGFARLDKNKTVDPTMEVREHIYMVASNATALRELLTAWERKSKNLPLKGPLSKFGNVFLHVIKVRRWGWQDRLREEELDLWNDILDDGTSIFRFEIELWFRAAAAVREKAQAQLEGEVEVLGGRVVRSFVHEGCGYHGLCVELQAGQVRNLLARRETAELFQEESVFHFWPTGQVTAKDSTDERGEDTAIAEHPPPNGPPELALFDGLPVENHPLLRGRLVVEDPENYSEDYPAAARNHGTQMASLIVCGDLETNSPRLSRPLYVRPIMRGIEMEDGKWRERIPSDVLPLDLLERAVIDLRNAAPTVKVVNLSIGDTARPFMGSPSAWARMLDWLQFKYGLLFIICAGNRSELPSPYATMTAFEDASDKDLERELVAGILADARAGRILSPAESINALTVGASHRDSCGVSISRPPGARAGILFSDLPSPSSRTGPGHRKSVKPDVLLSGGRQLLRLKALPDRVVLEPFDTPLGPGLKVAAPPMAGVLARTVYSRGTSVAAALATRRCAFLFDALRAMDESIRPGDEYFSVLGKALCIHPACWKDADGYLQDILGETPGNRWSAWRRKKVSPLIGHGVVENHEFMLGKANRVTLLAWGGIEPDKTLEFRFPLPSSIDGKAGRKRLTSTVAWFSPIHPGNARYRKAKLTLWPAGGSADSMLGVERRNGERNQLAQGTVHHEVFEGAIVRGLVEDELPMHLTCSTDAGKLEEPVRYGIAVTLEGAPDLFTRIYEEVRAKLALPVQIHAQ